MGARGRRALAALLVTVSLLSGLAFAIPAMAQTVLRVTMHSDLKIIDPIWTTALISADHGYLVYDTLFSLDESLTIRPQMVDRWEVSADRLTWTFTLREGLSWHDGTPVTGADCVASIRRWGARDSMGQMLMSFTSELSAPDDRTIRLVLREPYGLVLQALGKTGANIPFMMPKRIAETPPNSQIGDATGSGPFIFKRDEWKAGEKAVYVKNPSYKPRAEPPSGLAGGKIAKVDRVEWIWIADSQTQVNALLKGEIDLLQLTPYDLLPLVDKSKDVATQVVDKPGRQYIMRFNTLAKPFDDVRVRQAVTYALTQREFLEANIGDQRYYRECRSLFPCGLPLESPIGWEDRWSGDVAKAKKLLAEAGYDGTPLVLLHQTDVVGHNNLATVAKPQLERAGFKVELQAMDWQTLVGRRAKKDPIDKGGWHMFLTAWNVFDVWSPIANPTMDTRGEKSGWFGWASDDKLQSLRNEFMRATEDGAKKKLAEQMHARAFEVATHAPLGEYDQPMAAGKNISGFFITNGNIYWNIQKK